VELGRIRITVFVAHLASSAMRTPLRLMALTLVLAALSGCSLLAGPPPLVETWRVEMAVIGQPAVEDKVALAYEVWSSPVIEAHRRGSECEDDRDVCILGIVAGELGRYRLDLDTGEFETDDTYAAAPGVLFVGNKGLAFGTIDSEYVLARFDDQGIMWVTPALKIFGTEVRSEYGWSWDYLEDLDLFVGYIGQADYASDITRQALVGVNAETGELVWHRDNFDLDCNYIFPLEVEGSTTGVGCKYAGEAIYENDWFTDVDGLSVTVQGYSLVNGKTLWSIDAGSERAMYATWEGRLISRDDSPLMLFEGRVVRVDRETGEMTDYEGALLCAITARLDYFTNVAGDGVASYTGANNYQMCDTDLERIDGPFSIPRELLAEDVRVIATPGALVGLS
jgi:hypothetical protein